MSVHVPDRFKAANAFWIGLGKIGLAPAAVLNQARLPLTVYDGKKNLVTTAQFFALWRAVGELSADPAAGLKLTTQIDVGNRPPSTMAAYYAHDYRMLPMSSHQRCPEARTIAIPSHCSREARQPLGCPGVRRIASALPRPRAASS